MMMEEKTTTPEIDEQIRLDINHIDKLVKILEDEYLKGKINFPKPQVTELTYFLQNLLEKNKAFYHIAEVREVMKPICFRCLGLFEGNLEENTFLRHVLKMLIVIAQDNKLQLKSNEVEKILFCFERCIAIFVDQQRQAEHLVEVAPLFLDFLQIIEASYEVNVNAVDALIDSLILAMVWTTCTIEVNGYSATQVQNAVKLLSKISRKNAKILYPFVPTFFTDFLKDGKGNPLIMNEIISILSYLASRNVFIFKDYVENLNEIARNMNQSLIYQSISTILSRVGRLDPITARKCQLIFIQWMKDEVDFNQFVHFLNCIYNVAGVYKDSLLEDDFQFFEEFARQQSDMKIMEIIQKISEYFHNIEIFYLKEAFLQDQRDIYGRLIHLVDIKCFDSTKSLENHHRSISSSMRGEKLSEEEIFYIYQKDIDQLTGQIMPIGDRFNPLEAANLMLLQEQYNNAGGGGGADENSNLEELSKKIMQQEIEIRSFLTSIQLKLPFPTSYKARGTIRKRLILKFICHKERKPDFLFETNDWKIWMKIIFMTAITTATTSSMDPTEVVKSLRDIKTLYDFFKSPKEESFQSYMNQPQQQPFLISLDEENQLILSLRKYGYFNQFEYDFDSSRWYRKFITEISSSSSSSLPAPFVVSSASASSPINNNKSPVRRGSNTTSPTAGGGGPLSPVTPTRRASKLNIVPNTNVLPHQLKQSTPEQQRIISPIFVMDKPFKEMSSEEQGNFMNSSEWKALLPRQTADFHNGTLPIIYVGRFPEFLDTMPPPPSSYAEDHDFSYLGYGSTLYKAGGPLGFQRKRWFHIQGGKGRSSIVITYSVDPRGIDVKGRILLTDLIRVSPLETTMSGYWFIWYTKEESLHGGMYQLRCDRVEEYLGWVEVLRRCGVEIMQ